jgi:YfiH family protein
MVTVPPLAALGWVRHEFGTRQSEPLTGRVATLRQTHSDIVWTVRDGEGCLGDGDALVTDEPGLLLAIRTADCVPILLADLERRVVAAVHAGWRGTVAGILARTVGEMQSKYGTKPIDVVAAIGPSIGPCCFEVGPEVPLPVVGRKADLWAANREQLERVGVGRIWVAERCTMCEPESFYSFRRGKDTGRMVSAIGIRG